MRNILTIAIHWSAIPALRECDASIHDERFPVIAMIETPDLRTHIRLYQATRSRFP